MIGVTDVRNWETLGTKQTDGQTDHCIMQHNPWNRKREGHSLTSSLSKLGKWRTSREWFQLRNASTGALNWAHFTEWYRDILAFSVHFVLSRFFLGTEAPPNKYQKRPWHIEYQSFGSYVFLISVSNCILTTNTFHFKRSFLRYTV